MANPVFQKYLILPSEPVYSQRLEAEEQEMDPAFENAFNDLNAAWTKTKAGVKKDFKKIHDNSCSSK